MSRSGSGLFGRLYFIPCLYTNKNVVSMHLNIFVGTFTVSHYCHAMLLLVVLCQYVSFYMYWCIC